MGSALDELARRASPEAPELDLLQVMKRLLASTTDSSAPNRVAKAHGWCGSVAVFYLSGLYFVTWDHDDGQRGVEIVGRTSEDVAFRRARKVIRMAPPSQTGLPRRTLGLGNVRPWKPLPKEAEECIFITTTRNEDLASYLVLHRLQSGSDVQWLVTLSGEREILGRFKSLEAIAARLDRTCELGYEVDIQCPGLEWHSDIAYVMD